MLTKINKTHTHTHTRQIHTISVSFFLSSVCLPIASSTAGTADKFPLLACQQYYFTHKTRTHINSRKNPSLNPEYTLTFLIHQHTFSPLPYKHQNHLLCLSLLSGVIDKQVGCLVNSISETGSIIRQEGRERKEVTARPPGQNT